MSTKMTAADVKRLMEQTERDLNMGVFQAAWGTIASLFLVLFAGFSLGATVAITERNYAKERYLSDKLAELESLSKS